MANQDNELNEYFVEGSERRKQAKREHYEKYEALAQLMGVENVARFVPYKKDALVKALEEGDEHFNTFPLKRWDAATYYLSPPPREKLKEINHPFWSLSAGVCVLKHVARYHIAGAPKPE